MYSPIAASASKLKSQQPPSRSGQPLKKPEPTAPIPLLSRPKHHALINSSENGEDADPPSNRCTAFYRVIVPHGPILSCVAASPGGLAKPWTAKSLFWGVRSLRIEGCWWQWCLKNIPSRPWLKFGSGEDADPPSNRSAAFYEPSSRMAHFSAA